MKINYKNDELYCGVRKKIIQTAKPILDKKVVHEWFNHQRERTAIYYKKEILKEAPPWTSDKVLKTYKFVNTKRTWDKETKWLLKNVINNKNLLYEEKLLNCVLFRVINKGETYKLFDGAIKFLSSEIDIDKIRNNLNHKKKSDPKYVFFSAAYILGGPKVHFGKYIEKLEGKVEPNMILRMIKFVNYNKQEIINGILTAKTQKEVYDNLRKFSGIGKFLAYQMFIDMTYIDIFPFTEHNFVISGPGCDRGINWLFKNKDSMTQEECLFWFTENQFKIAKEYNEEWNMDKLFHFLPLEERIYTLMDMENSGACELDKRCRTLFNNKRPKQKYHY